MASSSSTGGVSGSSQQSSQILAAKETFAILQDLSRLLNTGLDSESLALCVRLCENGAHPQALATIIKEIKKQAQALKQEEDRNSSTA